MTYVNIFKYLNYPCDLLRPAHQQINTEKPDSALTNLITDLWQLNNNSNDNKYTVYYLILHKEVRFSEETE